ncbi:MAG TPA: AGE family epimerase/isomerase [Phycisphaerae bacterium]|jgi:mannobiose 2-epimerase
MRFLPSGIFSIMASALLPALALAQQNPAGPPITPSATPSIPPTKENYLKFEAEIEKSLVNDDLKKFFPASIDEQGGGYFQNFAEDWTHGTGGRRGAAGGGGGGGRGGGADTTRSIVYQSRLVWLSTQAASRYPAQKDEFTKYARQGATFLIEKQWDKTNGGWWWDVNAATGMPVTADVKHMYGEGFAIYALASYYQLTHDQAALDAAKKGFAWIEEHSHDSVNGGYYEQIKGDGTHYTSNANDTIGTRGGLKSMNTHIHLLEAFTALLEVWPDDLVKKRTEELYQLNLTKIYYDPGALHMFFNQDWTPADQNDSYGHDIEAAFLYAEAAKALGKPQDPAGWKAGKAIVDHCLNVAYSPANGFLFGEGTLQTPRNGNLEWWVEAESLNALLLMHETYGKNDPKYWDAFVKQWKFIQDHFIDKTNGGWYKGVNSSSLAATRGAKTDSWTEGYHQGRSMLTVTATLKKLAGE